MAKVDKKARQRAIDETSHMRSTVDRLLDKQGLHPVSEAFERQVGKIQKKLRASLRGRLRQPVSLADRHKVVHYLHAQALDLTDSIGTLLQKSTAATVRESYRTASRFLYKVRGEASAIDDEAMMRRIERRYAQKLATSREAAVQRMGADMSEKLREAAVLRAGREATNGDLIEAIESEFDDQWWRLERLVRTENSRAFNMIQSVCLEEVASEVHGLYGRWTEMVSDLTGQAMDKRVAEDSMAIHGQVAKPGRVFKMPDEPKVPPTLRGGEWEFPPNRPNDRAVLTPWMKDWGLPGWILQAGIRIPV